MKLDSTKTDNGSLIPTVGCAVGMLVGGLAGSLFGTFVGHEQWVVWLYAVLAVLGAILGSLVGLRIEAKRLACPKVSPGQDSGLPHVDKQ